MEFHTPSWIRVFITLVSVSVYLKEVITIAWLVFLENYMNDYQVLISVHNTSLKLNMQSLLLFPTIAIAKEKYLYKTWGSIPRSQRRLELTVSP